MYTDTDRIGKVPEEQTSNQTADRNDETGEVINVKLRFTLGTLTAAVLMLSSLFSVSAGAADAPGPHRSPTATPPPERVRVLYSLQYCSRQQQRQSERSTDKQLTVDNG